MRCTHLRKDIEIDATEAPGGVKALGVFFDWGSGASMEQSLDGRTSAGLEYVGLNFHVRLQLYWCPQAFKPEQRTQIPKRSTFTVSAAGDEVLYFLALGLCRTKERVLRSHLRRAGLGGLRLAAMFRKHRLCAEQCRGAWKNIRTDVR